MTDHLEQNAGSVGGKRRIPSTVLIGVLVVVLALAALILPRAVRQNNAATVLIFDPLRDTRRDLVYDPLVAWLEQATGGALRLELVAQRSEFRRLVAGDVRIVLCPDGAALDLPEAEYTTLATGRRAPPHNLRPRSVLVYRRTAGLTARPWLSAASRTVFGDSLSLSGFGVVCQEAETTDGSFARPSRNPAWTFGPDPYDHAPVLHALRLGCFDYAVVRQWTAEMFLDNGLLSAQDWGVEHLTVPVPDLVLMAARDWPTPDRLQLAELLHGLGRQDDEPSSLEDRLLAGLDRIGLSGFNVLLEPDFELIRRRFDRCWPKNDN